MADDHPIFRLATRRSLEGAGGFEVVGEASTVPSLLAEVARAAPDAVLLDLRLPGDGLAAIDALRATVTERVRIIVLSAVDDPRTIRQALERGASAYIVKTIGRPDIAAAVRQCVSRSLFVARVPADTTPAHAAEASLTARERSILDGLVCGLTNRQIAAALWVSERTVQFHLRNVYRKLAVRNRTEAVARALEGEWAQPPEPASVR